MAVKKKGNLPFVVQPRLEPIKEVIGTDESGKIEIERKGYLTVAEKALVQASVDEGPVTALYALSRRISRGSGIDFKTVLADLSEGGSASYFGDYQEEVSEVLANLIRYQENLKIIQVTSLLIYRIDSKWTVEDTMDLHPDILNELAILFLEEEKKSLERLLKKTENGGEAAEGK